MILLVAMDAYHGRTDVEDQDKGKPTYAKVIP